MHKVALSQDALTCIGNEAYKSRNYASDQVPIIDLGSDYDLFRSRAWQKLARDRAATLNSQ